MWYDSYMQNLDHIASAITIMVAQYADENGLDTYEEADEIWYRLEGAVQDGLDAAYDRAADKIREGLA